MEGPDIKNDEDISATMMRRARCLRVARYSMNTSSNIKMLSEDIPSSESSADAFLLIRLWSWIDRVESFCFDAEEIEDGFRWSAKSLMEAGVWRLLNIDSDSNEDVSLFSEALSCNIYDSPARR